MKILFIGLLITIIFWFLAWTHLTPIYEYTFFPLWFGYIITINGLSLILLGTSLLTKMKRRFFALFVISAPFWWFFEFANVITSNWHYILPHPVTLFEHIIRASLAFSTVVPAVLSTTFLFFQILNKLRILKSKSFSITYKKALSIIALGLISFLLIYAFPQLSFPLVWLGLFLILDPINYLLGFPSILKYIKMGQLNLPIATAFATLFTGFWWEMWNYYSMPKWFYTIPYVGYFKIFEMPILGYFGYLFFGLEVYAFASFAIGMLKKLFRLTLQFPPITAEK